MTTVDSQLKKAAIIIPKTHIVLQEFLALMAGIKPVINCGIPEEDIQLIRSNFPNLYIVSGEQTLWHRRIEISSISYNKLLAQRTLNAFCGKGDTPDVMGKLLGYPKCCTESWVKYIHADQQHNAPLVTYEAYKTAYKCSPFANNLLNFSSRVGDNEVKDFEKCGPLNMRLSIPFHYFQFISHVPCRYDCQESIKMGKEIDFLMKRYTPDIERVVKATLSKPILFFDLFKLAVLDGRVKNKAVYYQKISLPFFLLDKPIFKALKSGNKLTANDKQVEIFKDDRSLFVYKKQNIMDGFILDFGEK